MQYYQAQSWQKDFQTIITPKGQLWSENGNMLGVRPKAVLQAIIKEKRGFAINNQAVCLYDKE